jgi:hypothetical protein
MKIVFTTLVMLYLALDFGDPNLPGANSFDPDESVEVIQLQRDPAPSPPPLAVTPEPFIRQASIRGVVQRVGRSVDRGLGIAPALHATRHFAPDPSGSEEG